MKLSHISRLLIGFLLVLFVFPNVGSFFSPPTDADTAAVLTDEGSEAIRQGNVFIQIASLVLCIIAVLYTSFVHMIRTVLKHRLAMLYMVFLISSLAYSISLDLTVRRLILFGIVACLGFVQVHERDSSVERLLKTIYVFGLIYAGILVIGLARSALAGHEFFVSRFSLFGQGYTDAEILSFTLLLHWFFRGDQTVKMPRSVRTLLWLILPLGIVSTLSRTAIACLIASGTYILIQRTGKHKVSTFLGAVLALSTMILLIPGPVLQGILRPETVETLTGRTALWEFLLDFVSVNPYWGAGFGAYWSDTNIIWVQIYQGWAAPAAHNGFLDVFLNTGFIGLAFVIAILVNAWLSTGVFSSDTKTILRAILVYVLVQNITQGSFQSPRVFVEVIFWWVYIQIVEGKIRARRLPKPIPDVAGTALGFAS